MSDFFPYQFDGTIEEIDHGKMTIRAILLPESIAAQGAFKKSPRTRVSGEVGGHPFFGAWQPMSGGRRFLLISKRFLKEADLSVGDSILVRFQIEDDDAVELPEELHDLLLADKEARAAFEALTPGRQRGLAHVASVGKTPATRRKKAAAILADLLAGKPIRPGEKKKASA